MYINTFAPSLPQLVMTNQSHSYLVSCYSTNCLSCKGTFVYTLLCAPPTVSNPVATMISSFSLQLLLLNFPSKMCASQRSKQTFLSPMLTLQPSPTKLALSKRPVQHKNKQTIQVIKCYLILSLN